MLGDNPKRPPVSGDGNSLFVKKIFKTLQGEGVHAGVPAIFIRLGGCNLACSFCDTEFEDYHSLDLSKILAEISSLRLNDEGRSVIDLVVITGGEPFRQQISPLCQGLLALGVKVQIETNGTIYREIPEDAEIICSPKVAGGKYLQVRREMLPRVTAFKFLISCAAGGYALVPELGQREYDIPVFVQPMDEYNDEVNLRNKQLAIDIAINNGYRLSYQLHKVLGIE
ncbi:MAG: radical SAM protein [Rickettsiales bacterium]|nr:MAG: radical SAM protein [Rickettsiales bacterium]